MVTQPNSFDHKWVKGMGACVAASLLAIIIVGASRSNLVGHLQSGGFNATEAGAIFSFVLGELAWYLLFLALGATVLSAIISGLLGANRTRWAWLVLGLLLTLDLTRANAPWIIYQNYRYKYASNPIIDLLRQNPYEHRVQIVPFRGDDALGQLQELYGLEWSQHLFPYYDIQSLDLVMEPRVAKDNQAYRSAFTSPDLHRNIQLLLRKWELTNTRYLLGLSGDFVTQLNQQLDPEHGRFRLHTAFDLVPKGESAKTYVDITASIRTNGNCGLIEFTGALPRAKLFSKWRTVTNDAVCLSTLTDPQFDPHEVVLVDGPTLVGDPADAAINNAGSVTFVAYQPKRVEFAAHTDRAAVLLLNDKYHPDWQVTVDGQPAPLLRCNYLMRGVMLPVGDHRVVFSYRPPTVGLYVSLLGILVATALCGFLMIPSGRRSASEQNQPA